MAILVLPDHFTISTAFSRGGYFYCQTRQNLCAETKPRAWPAIQGYPCLLKPSDFQSKSVQKRRKKRGNLSKYCNFLMFGRLNLVLNSTAMFCRHSAGLARTYSDTRVRNMILLLVRTKVHSCTKFSTPSCTYCPFAYKSWVVHCPKKCVRKEVSALPRYVPNQVLVLIILRGFLY